MNIIILFLILISPLSTLANDQHHIHHTYKAETLTFELNYHLDGKHREGLIPNISRNRMLGKLRAPTIDPSNNIDVDIKTRTNELQKISDDLLRKSKLKKIETKNPDLLRRLSKTERSNASKEKSETLPSKKLQIIEEISTFLEQKKYLDAIHHLAITNDILANPDDEIIAEKYKWLVETYFESGILRLPSLSNHAPLVLRTSVNRTETEIERYLLNLCIAHHSESCVDIYSNIAILSVLDSKQVLEFKKLANLLTKSPAKVAHYVEDRVRNSPNLDKLRRACSFSESCPVIITELISALHTRYIVNDPNLTKIFQLQITKLIQNESIIKKDL